MNRRIFLATALRAALCSVLCAALGGCVSRPRMAFTPLQGEKTESQWEMRLLDGDSDTPLTGAMAASSAVPGEGRLYVMLPMGQTLGKCVLSGGGAFCEASVPGAAPLLQKAATPMARMLLAGFPPENAVPQGRGWLCGTDGDWLVYREAGAGWTLRLRKIK